MGGKGSGGRRPGAGRPPGIDEITQWQIAEEYTERYNALARLKARRLREKKLEKRGFYENLAEINRVPIGVLCSKKKGVCVNLRRLVLKWGQQYVARDAEKAVRRVLRLADDEMIPLKKGKVWKEGEDLVELVVDGIEAMRGNLRSLDQRDGRIPPLGRYYSVLIRRPKGVQEIATELTKKYSVSERTVRTIITEHSKLLKIK